MAKFNNGDRVQVRDEPGSMQEFIGKTGTVVDSERHGELFFRVELDEPVYVKNVGQVGDDIWMGRFLKKVK